MSLNELLTLHGLGTGKTLVQVQLATQFWNKTQNIIQQQNKNTIVTQL